MQYEIDNIYYDVVIEKKRIRNLYIRFKDNKIQLNVPFLVSNKDIYKLLDNNINALRKMIKRSNLKEENSFLGEKVDIVAISNLKHPEYINGKIYIKNKDKLKEAYKYLAEPIFNERLKYVYSLFDEYIPYPILKIRKMTSRWGVCNRKNNSITLNSDLIKFSYEYIDYVIVHELSHFIHFNHSKLFWNTVSKYYPSYKIIRKKLRE